LKSKRANKRNWGTFEAGHKASLSFHSPFVAHGIFTWRLCGRAKVRLGRVEHQRGFLASPNDPVGLAGAVNGISRVQLGMKNIQYTLPQNPFKIGLDAKFFPSEKLFYWLIQPRTSLFGVR
jgi:hypothetical protein